MDQWRTRAHWLDSVVDSGGESLRIGISMGATWTDGGLAGVPLLDPGLLDPGRVWLTILLWDQRTASSLTSLVL